MTEPQMERVEVVFRAMIFTTNVKFRFRIELYVNQIPTGIQAFGWGKKMANRIAQNFVDNGNVLLNQYGKAQWVLDELRAVAREERMARVQVGDKVKLLVDIGSIKKGRVCNIVEVAEPSFYVSRGANAWDDDLYPIKVVPVYVATDTVPLGPKDAIPLKRGEFGPLDEEVAD